MYEREADTRLVGSLDQVLDLFLKPLGFRIREGDSLLDHLCPDLNLGLLDGFALEVSDCEFSSPQLARSFCRMSALR